MNLNEFNSLIDLYFYQAKKQHPQSIFLEWLNPQNKKRFTFLNIPHCDFALRLLGLHSDHQVSVYGGVVVRLVELNRQTILAFQSLHPARKPMLETP